MLFNIVFSFYSSQLFKGNISNLFVFSSMQEFCVNNVGEYHAVTDLVAAGSLLVPLCTRMLLLSSQTSRSRQLISLFVASSKTNFIIVY
jgi:hypothetical protein